MYLLVRWPALYKIAAGGGGRSGMREDKRPPPHEPGTYSMNQAGYNCKYEEDHGEMAQSRNDMREGGALSTCT